MFSCQKHSVNTQSHIFPQKWWLVRGFRTFPESEWRSGRLPTDRIPGIWACASFWQNRTSDPKCWQRSNGVILIIACSEVPFSVSVCTEGSQLPGGLSALRFQCKRLCRGWVLAVGALAAATLALGALPWELSVSSGAAGAGGWGYAPLPPGSPARQRCLSSGGRFSLVPKAPRVSALLCRAVIFTGCGTCRKDSGRQRKT